MSERVVRAFVVVVLVVVVDVGVLVVVVLVVALVIIVVFSITSGAERAVGNTLFPMMFVHAAGSVAEEVEDDAKAKTSPRSDEATEGGGHTVTVVTLGVVTRPRALELFTRPCKRSRGDLLVLLRLSWRPDCDPALPNGEPDAIFHACSQAATPSEWLAALSTT